MTSNAKACHPENEFHRPVDIARLQGESTYQIAADAEERAALARRLGLAALDRLEAKVRLERLSGGLLRFTATMAAELAQLCVVTLEPVPARIDEQFSLLYRSGRGERQREVMVSASEEDIEPLDGTVLDIGEAVAQQLSLALDPFPRAPGAAPAEPENGPVAAPFAALAKWREKG